MRSLRLWALLPILYSVFAAVGLWVVYVIALEHETITPLSCEYRKNDLRRPPYISVAGTTPPASCVFSQVMNLAAFVGFIIGILRCLQLKHWVRRPWLNVGSAVAFSLACFGMTLVGNFQLTNDEDIHNIGTSLTFGLGTLFCWVQSFLTLEVNLKNEGRMVGVLRLLLSAVITACLMLYTILMNLQLHMYAARTQWALVMFFLTFISTFAVEFRHQRFETVCREYEALSRQPETFAEVPAEYETNGL